MDPARPPNLRPVRRGSVPATGDAVPVRITVEWRPGGDQCPGAVVGVVPELSPGPAPCRVDVDVSEGSRLGVLRASLAALTGIGEIAAPGARFSVGARAVGDDQLCGLAPLEAGSVLTVGPPRPDPAADALRSVWHLAVLSGPDSGGLRGVDDATVVGRGPGVDLQVDDPLVSRRHLTVRRRGDRLQVRDDGSHNGTVRRRRGRTRPLSRQVGSLRAVGRWHRLRDGDRLVLGSTSIEVRHRDGTSARASAPGAAGASAPPGPHTTTVTSPVALSTWFTPVVSAVVLAMGTGNPRMLLLAATGPVLALVQLVAGLRSRRRVRHASPSSDRGAPRPAAPSGRVADVAARDAVVVPSPADVVTGTLRLHERHPGAAGIRPLHLADLTPDACLAVVGPREHALAVARGLVTAATASGGADDTPPVVVRHPPGASPQWSWCRWIGTAALLAADDAAGTAATRAPRPSVPVAGHGPHAAALTVIDPSGGPWPASASSLWRDAPAGSQLILVGGSLADVPPWCHTVLEVEAGRADALLRCSDGRTYPVPLPAVSIRTAEHQSRRAAALRARTRGTNEPDGLPASVPWNRLPGTPDLRDGPASDEITARWSGSSTDPGLAVPIGIGVGGAVVSLDLVADGPHALVAGTTGAGKSALLQTLVLGLASTRSPADLAIALIDYKGGASLGDCARLPHVVGQVTDLDPALAMRALAGLRHELRLRERLVAAHGVSDLDQLRSAWAARASGPAPSPTELVEPPPRLLVVVDEFRALADDLPGFLPDLLRIAAQGRSLGMHLVLATQRPGGAVSADMRANISLRIALRVTDEADSLDIVGVPDAARIPAGVPGRAVVRRGTAPAELVQVAHADVRGDGSGGDVGVRPAAAWGDFGAAAGATPSPSRDAAEDARAVVGLSQYVDAVVAAAVAAGARAPRAPWLPELPTSLPLDALADDGSPGLPFALADVPESQARAVARLAVGQHLLVVGGAGSGRTTTLRTLAVSGLSAGWHVHAVGLDGQLADLRAHPGLGTVVGHGDGRLLGRLLDLLVRRDSGGVPALLVVDGLEPLLDVLDQLDRSGAARGRTTLASLLRDARSREVSVAVTAAPATGIRSEFPEIVVLPGTDPVTRTMLGVPASLGEPTASGRAIHLGGAGTDAARVCQIAVAEQPPGTTQLRTTPPGTTPPGTTPPGSDPLRLAPIPLEAPVVSPRTRSRAATWVGVGLGGDDATETGLDLSRGALVVGPPGSGRSTTLGVLAGQLGCTTALHVVTADGRPLPGLPDTALTTATWSFDAAALRRLVGAIAAAERPLVVVVDDLDDLERLRPQECGELVDVLTVPSTGSGPRALVASARTARVCVAYREPWTSLRATRRGIVLSPGESGSDEVFGTPLDRYRDHDHPHLPGRGVVQAGSVVTPVQVYRGVEPPGPPEA